MLLILGLNRKVLIITSSFHSRKRNKPNLWKQDRPSGINSDSWISRSILARLDSIASSANGRHPISPTEVPATTPASPPDVAPVKGPGAGQQNDQSVRVAPQVLVSEPAANRTKLIFRTASFRVRRLIRPESSFRLL